MRARRRDQLHRLAPRYTVPVHGGELDSGALFGRHAPLVLEIGSGMGDATAALAAADPHRDYLAVEVHTPGVAHLLGLIETHQLPNLRVVHGDALELLRQRLAPTSLDRIVALFPDPWPKLRHHKRRLFQPRHVALMRDRLVPGGFLHTATDWPDYARAIRATLTADPALVDVSDGGAPERARTKYEQRAVDAGRSIIELVFRRR